MGEQVTPNLVVHLVHGTFAKDAPWIHEDSDLCRCLHAGAGAPVTFRPFNWSGGNSHDDRLQAGQALSSHLRQSLEQHADSRHFIIAHSHGGNVSLYAMRDPALEKDIAGIVCLGTPFIHCRPRRFRIALIAFIASLLLLGSAVIVFSHRNIGTTLPGNNEPLKFSSFICIAVAVAAAVLPACYAIFTRLPRLRSRQQAIIKRLALPKELSCPVFCVGAVEDEAAKLLRTLWLVSELPFLAAILVIMAFPALLAPAMNWQKSEWLPNIALIGVAWFAWLLALYPVSIFLPRILHAGAFGGESIMDNWLVSIFIRPLPPKARNLDQRRYFFWTIIRLGHSTLYQKEQILTDVAAWIRSHATTPARNALAAT